MTGLTQAAPAMSRWRLLDWAGRAWQRMSWRHVALALPIEIGRTLFGPLGGVFFSPTAYDYWIKFLNASWLVSGATIVYCVLVADEAFDDGVPPWRAYGLAVVCFSLLGSVADWSLGGSLGTRQAAGPEIAWWTQVLLFQGGMGTSIYAYWRVTQRSMRRAQAAETERLRNEQRVQTSRLLALQARVEPQMLFDALGRVAALHVREPQAGDALLADLIALLRAMQPQRTADNSTVEREFALVEAWIRVNRGATRGAPRVRLEMTPESSALGIAPMLVLPLLRAALASRGAAELEWVLSAHSSRARLTITLKSTAGMDTACVATSQELASLQERLLRLFGRSAGLSVQPHVPSLTLDLPRLQEDPDDNPSDR